MEPLCIGDKTYSKRGEGSEGRVSGSHSDDQGGDNSEAEVEASANHAFMKMFPIEADKIVVLVLERQIDVHAKQILGMKMRF